MATWRRKPKAEVLIHSDQASQFTSIDWAAFLKVHDLENSMTRWTSRWRHLTESSGGSKRAPPVNTDDSDLSPEAFNRRGLSAASCGAIWQINRGLWRRLPAASQYDGRMPR